MSDFIFIPQMIYAPNAENDSTFAPMPQQFAPEMNPHLLGQTDELAAGFVGREITLNYDQCRSLYNLQAQQLVHYPQGTGSCPGVWILRADAEAMGIVAPLNGFDVAPECIPNPLTPPAGIVNQISNPQVQGQSQVITQQVQVQAAKGSKTGTQKTVKKKVNNTTPRRSKLRSPFDLPKLTPPGY